MSELKSDSSIGPHCSPLVVFACDGHPEWCGEACIICTGAIEAPTQCPWGLDEFVDWKTVKS